MGEHLGLPQHEVVIAQTDGDGGEERWRHWG
jgi:hypothetical protein